MRQVPTYLFIGNGRVSRHFQCYFKLLNLPVLLWSRKQHSLSDLHVKSAQATHILLLIHDDAIQHFLDENLTHTSAIKIHCSGSLVSKGAISAHPLMTFGENSYSLQAYQAMPFIIDADAPPFTDLLPGLPNPHARLSAMQKDKYHAMCVLSGNFSCLLWQKLFLTFEQEFNLPREFVYPYLQQQLQNILQHAESALTGPLVRGDVETIARNINALEGDAFQQVYQSFVECYRREHA